LLRDYPLATVGVVANSYRKATLIYYLTNIDLTVITADRWWQHQRWRERIPKIPFTCL